MEANYDASSSLLEASCKILSVKFDFLRKITQLPKRKI